MLTHPNSRFGRVLTTPASAGVRVLWYVSQGHAFQWAKVF